MVEAKGTPASNKNDKSPIQVNSAAELREWCALLKGPLKGECTPIGASAEDTAQEGR